MRYVDEGAPLDQRQQIELGPDAWRGTVQLTYRYQGFDESPARLETGVVFVPSGDGVRIASFGGADERTPLWLADRLSVVRTPRTLVAVAADSPGRYPALATRAVRQVSRVLPDWSGSLWSRFPPPAEGWTRPWRPSPASTTTSPR